MLKFKKSLFLYFLLQSFLDYPSCHAERETPDLCKGSNLLEFTVAEGWSALVWRQFLRAVISWWMNQIRALRLCLLLTDNLITIFLLSSFIAISLLLTFTPLNLSHPILPLSALLCHSGLCLSPPFYFYCCPPPLSKVVLLDTTTVLGELDWKTYPVNGVSEKIISYYQNIQTLHPNKYNPEPAWKHHTGETLYCRELKMTLAVSKNHPLIHYPHLSRVELTTLCTRWWAANTNRCIMKDIGAGLVVLFFLLIN